MPGVRHDDHYLILLPNLQGPKSVSPSQLQYLGRYRALPPLDQFEHYPEDQIQHMIRSLPDEERSKARQRLQRGIWPFGILAYIERID